MAKIRGLSTRLVSSVSKEVELPQDVASASMIIMSNEYKPVVIFKEDAEGNQELERYYIASPSIFDVIALKNFVETVVKRMNPDDPCNCAYTIAHQKRREYELIHGMLNPDTQLREDALVELKARQKALSGVLKKMKDPAVYGDTLSKFQQDAMVLERLVSEREEELSAIQAELAKYPKSVPHVPASLRDMEVCEHCHKQIPVPPLVLLTDNDTYDKVCQLVLGTTLEEAGKIIPISQIKYLWSYLVQWVFAVPNNLPKAFLAQMAKAMSFLPMNSQLKEIVGMAETVQSEMTSGVSTTSGLN